MALQFCRLSGRALNCCYNSRKSALEHIGYGNREDVGQAS